MKWIIVAILGLVVNLHAAKNGNSSNASQTNDGSSPSKFGFLKIGTGSDIVVNSAYVGGSIGLGAINSSSTPYVIKSDLISQIHDQATFLALLNTTPTKGGLAGRVYIGYLASFIKPKTPPVIVTSAIGPEVGLSFYPTSSVVGLENIAYAPYVGVNYSDKITYKGYGVDILGNISVIYNRIVLALKVGAQYAIQSGIVKSSLMVQEQGQSELNLGLKNEGYTSNRILPELIVQAKWQPFPIAPIFLGLSYQYVFGSAPNSNNDFTQVNSRNMIALDIEIIGW